MKVYKKPCKNCLYSKNKIVSNERKAQLLKGCKEENTFFVCHVSSIENGNVCCHNFYKKEMQSEVEKANLEILVSFVDLPEKMELDVKSDPKDI